MSKITYIGISLITLSTLMLELTLTRIFSVTMWYHFAFMTISLVLLGISASGVLVFINEKLFLKENFSKQIIKFSLLYAFSTLLSIIIYLSIPIVNKSYTSGIVILIISFILFFIPFFIGGFIVALSFTHFSEKGSIIYTADLIGAGVGCLVTTIILKFLSGPTAIIFITFLIMLGTLFFSIGFKNKKWITITSLISLGIFFLIPLNIKFSWLKVRYNKSYKEENVIYEKWNPIARITLFDVSSSVKEGGWGVSSLFNGYIPPEMWIDQDAHAGTPITKFDGDLSKLEFLSYDITAFGYHIRPIKSSFIVGPGGGRDILTSLFFGVSKVVATEINPDIIDIVNNKYGFFSGSPYFRENVISINGEARSVLTHDKNKYDFIQISLADSWASSAAGAFVLVENNLYTIEAFLIYISHLTDNGILSISRWFTGKYHGETVKTVMLGVLALDKIGIKNPIDHIAVVEYSQISTFLMKKSPFTDEEIEKIRSTSDKLNFNLLLLKGYENNLNILEEITYSSNKLNLKRIIDDYPINITPPTDDRPFFFNMQKIGEFFLKSNDENQEANVLPPSLILNSAFLLCFILSLIFIFFPLYFKSSFNLIKDIPLKRVLRYIIYFSMLGIGFMLIEIALIQKYILFLGHPIYAMSVVLFSILILSGIGSFSTNKINKENITKKLKIFLMIIIFITLLNILFLPYLHKYFLGYPLLLRIVISFILIGLLGFFLGVPFPSGIKIINYSKETKLIPWIWAINGTSSVLASILAIFIAIHFGYTYSLIGGGIAYLVALLCSPYINVSST